MAERFTFPQSGDNDDAEHFAAMIGQDNLSNFVSEGIQLTPDYTVPEVSVTTGKAFVQTASETASSSGDTILKTNFVVQVPAQTVSLQDGTTNYVYLQPDLSTDDNGSVAAFTSVQPGDALLLAEIDTTNDTIQRYNQEPSAKFGTIRIPDDQKIIFGDGEDYSVSYDSSLNVLTFEDSAGSDLVNFAGGSSSFFGDITDGTNTIYDNTNDWVPQARLENDSITVNANDGLQSGGTVALGGSVGIDIDEDFDFTFTSAIDFSAGLDTQGDITDGAQTIWDASAQEIPDSAMGSIANSTLTNSSVTVNAGTDLTGGGSISLGSSATINADSASIRASASDSGTTVLSGPSDLNFASNLTVMDDGDGTVTIDATDTNTDTRTNVSDNGALVVSDTTDINFSSNLTVTDDADGSVTVDAQSSTDTRTDVSDSGTLVVSDTTDINFSSNLTVTDDADGSVTVDAQSSTDTTTDISENGTTIVAQTSDINFTASGAATVNVSDDGDGTGTVNIDSTDTNTNTTYSAGNALSLNGTQFNVNEGAISHDNLSNISSGDHHSRYSDSEAISAVENASFTSLNSNTLNVDNIDAISNARINVDANLELKLGSSLDLEPIGGGTLWNILNGDPYLYFNYNNIVWELDGSGNVRIEGTLTENASI